MSESVKEANVKRAKKAKYEQESKKRADEQATLKGAYLAGNGEIILDDIKKKILTWQKLNTKIAQDGMGARPTGHKLVDGTPEMENVFLTPVQRASYLDKNAGLQSLYDYIERQLTRPNSEEQPKQKKTTKKQ